MKLPIAMSDFREIIEGNCYYVDKTQFIEAVINDDAKVILITRPRRFGKTLNFSMLQYFLDIKEAEKNRALFKGLKIEQAGKAFFDAHQGKYPIISISFKDIKHKTFEETYATLRALVSKLYLEHDYVMGVLKEPEKKIFQKIIDKEAAFEEIQDALKNLTEYLYRYYNIRPIVLLDEYDTPFHASYSNQYMENLLNIMRPLMSGVFKDNKYLGKGVITGILRIAQTSIFSGFNNPGVRSIFSARYADCFGFLDTEVEELLKVAKASNHKQIITEWYNGYQFDKFIIYNPWSLIQFLDNECFPDIYWLESSSNSLISDLLKRADTSVKFKLEKLLQPHQFIEELVSKSLSFKDLMQTTEGLWTLLVFSGYLKPIAVNYGEMGTQCKLAIPNKEVRAFYLKSIKEWFSSENQKTASAILTALTTANIDEFKKLLGQYVMQTFSFWDQADTKDKHPEKVYHAFFLGMLIHLDSQQYQIKSNRESGEGRYDVMIIPKDKKQLAILLEFKSIDSRSSRIQLQQSASNALKQIIAHSYATELVEAQIENVLMVGIAFAGKKVDVAYKQGLVSEFLSSVKSTLTLNTSTPNVNPPPSAFAFLAKPQSSKQALTALIPSMNLARSQSESSTSSKISLFSQPPQPKANVPIITKPNETTSSAAEKRKIYSAVDQVEEKKEKPNITSLHDIAEDVETISSSEEEALDLKNVKKKKFDPKK